MSSPLELYLAIDCGATKTAAALCLSSGVTVARAVTKGSNFTYLGFDAFLESIRSAVSSVLTTALRSSTPIVLPFDPTTHPDPAGAGIPPYRLQAAWLGVAGVDSSATISLLLPRVSTLLSVPIERLIISNDTHLLAAPLSVLQDVQTAVVVVAGTGSIVSNFRKGLGDALPEVLARVGGWGWILGDEGGGFDVGRTALRALLAQEDSESTGAAVTRGALRGKVLKKFGVAEVMELLAAVQAPDSTGSQPREKRLSSLCPLVFEAAFEDDDPIAKRVLHECAYKLAKQISAVLLSPSAKEVRAHPHLI